LQVLFPRFAVLSKEESLDTMLELVTICQAQDQLNTAEALLKSLVVRPARYRTSGGCRSI
jgi:hypothetical protein